MRVLFMGTPDIAAKCLSALLSAGIEVAAIFTQPDRPKGRGMKLMPSPVKTLALLHRIEVLQPLKMKKSIVEIERIAPDMIVVAAYGRLLPQVILDYPKFGCINLHASLLPKLRGAAPIQRAVVNGDTLGGVTTMHMAAELDAGDMIFKAETPISESDTGGSLHDRYAEIGGELLVKTIRAISDGTAPRTAQDSSLATFAPPIQKEEARVDWAKTSSEIRNLIRGFNPYPTAFTSLDGVPLKLFWAEIGSGNGVAGEVISADADGLEVATADGSVIITELQAAGKKRMSAADWLRGHNIPQRTRLG